MRSRAAWFLLGAAVASLCISATWVWAERGSERRPTTATPPMTTDTTSFHPTANFEPCRPDWVSATFSGVEGAMQTTIVGVEIEADRRCVVERVDVALGNAPGYAPPFVHNADQTHRGFVVGPNATVDVSMQVWHTDESERRPCTNLLPFRMAVNGRDVSVTNLDPRMFDCQVLRVGVHGPNCRSGLEKVCRQRDS